MNEIALQQPKRNALSRLWNNQESRSVIIQILAVAAIFAAVYIMAANAIANLTISGKGIGFDFLWQISSYDISQHLIPYTSQSTHFKAMVVGIINTLLIAVSGIIFATLLGFLLGICRLSKNWIINRLAYVYIEYVRNVPVLIHIYILYGLIVNTLPKIKNAIGFGDVAFLSNRGFYSPKPLFEELFWIVIALFFIGIIFSIIFSRYAKRVQDDTGKRYPIFWICLTAIVIIPWLMYFLLGSPITWEVPALKGFNFQGGLALEPEFIALWLALSLYTAAFIGEIVRAGIIAVNYGQTEASAALGINRNRTLNLVVIPQALRVIIPPLTSQYLNLTKNSSLAIAIGYMDITGTIGGITLNQTGREMECMAIVLALYLTFSLIISAGMNWYNKRIKLIER